MTVSRDEKSPKESLELEIDIDKERLCVFERMRSNKFLKYILPKIKIKGLFMLTFSILAIIQGMSYAYFSATLTTLEKRLKISSKTATLVMSGNEVSQILFSIPLSYLGGKGHRPRWMGIGVFMSSLSCFLLASPHLIYGPGDEALSLTYEYEDYFDRTQFDYSNNHTNSVPKNGLRRMELCDGKSENMELNCDPADNSLTPLFLIFMSQFVAGIGVLLFFTLGGPYMDDNMKQTQMPFIMGLTMSFRLIGPVIGFLFASLCLRMFISPSLTPMITPDDSRWLGAWWLGWVVMGSLMMVMSFLIALFPKNLPKSNSNKERECNENNLSLQEDKVDVPNEKLNFADLSKCLKLLVKNRINLFNTLAGIFYLFGALSFGFFLPKYIETIYRMNASDASIISGTSSIGFQAIGLITSGALISKYQPGARKLAGFNVFTGVLFLGALITTTQLTCHQGHIEIRPGNPSWSLNLTQDCNLGCHCNSEMFDPVCHQETDTVFYSPCHAGCQIFENESTLSNCSCLPLNAIVVKGTCTDKSTCPLMFYAFIGLGAAIRLIDSFGRIGNVLIGYRCVDPSHKSLAIGLAVFSISLVSSLPSPILFGAIIDSVCLVWGSKCGGKGNCLLYDSHQFVYAFNMTAFGFIALGVIFDTFVYYYVKDLDLYNEENNIKVEKSKK